MSKQVKNLITNEITARFKDIDGVAVINPRGINAIKNNLIRRRLREKGLRMTVVKNTLARRAIGDDSKIKGFDRLLDGPSAVVYGQKASISVIARALLEEKKTDETIELRGIFFDGEIYAGEKGVQQVSKLPTREEAIATVLSAILAPGRKLGGILKGQAGKIAALLKSVEERSKEKESAAPAPVAPDAAAPAAEAAAPAGDAAAPAAAAAPETPPSA